MHTQGADGLRTYSGGVAVVTGGASGIGRALARELAARGCKVVLADIEKQDADQAAADIRVAGGQAEARELDVRDAAAVAQVITDTLAQHGRLDYLFNNAGIGVTAPLEGHTLQDWRKVVDVNFMGVIHGVHAALPVMKAQGFGHIVNTASMAGLVAVAGFAAYTAAKFGVVGLTECLRVETAQYGLRASVLCPGVIRTAILDYGGKHGKVSYPMTEEQLADFLRRARPMPAPVFARKALKAVARNRAIIIYPGWWKVFWWLNRLCPATALRVGRYVYHKTLRDLDLQTGAKETAER